MAEDTEATEESSPTEKKSSNILMIIIIIVLFLIIIIGGVVAFLLMGNDEEQINKPQAKQERSAPRKVSKGTNSQYDDTRTLDEIGTLYPLDTFTVNLKSNTDRRYLKVTLSLELQGEELSTELDAKSAVLRDRIIRILTSKTLEEVSSKKGKQKVSQQIMNTLNAMLSNGKIKGIYFTEFVIQ